MTNLTADDKKKLAVGIAVGAALLFLAFRWLRSDGIFASVGPEYETAFYGTASVGQVVLSLLISLGGTVLTIGTDLLKRWLGWTTGPGATVIDAARDELLERLQKLAAERLAVRDQEGYAAVYELYDHCVTSDAKAENEAAK